MCIALRLFLFSTTVALAAGSGATTHIAVNPLLDDSFRLMYELKFDAARTRLGACRQADPEDPLCAAAEAASYLFERFNENGVLTSSFFLNDKLLLGGIAGPPDQERNAPFLEANQRARKMAEMRLKIDSRNPGALLTLALTDGICIQLISCPCTFCTAGCAWFPG